MLPMGYSRKEDQDRPFCRTRQDVQQTLEKGQGLYYTYSGRQNHKRFWRCGICKKTKMLAIQKGTGALGNTLSETQVRGSPRLTSAHLCGTRRG